MSKRSDPTPLPVAIHRPSTEAGAGVAHSIWEQESERTRTLLASALRRKRRIGGLERIVEGGIFLISLSAVALVFLIFLFIAREAAPTILQRATTAQTAASTAQGTEIPTEPAALAAFLGLSLDELKSLDEETIHFLAESVAEERAKSFDNPDRSVNALSYSKIFLPHRWHGEKRAIYSWDPASPTSPKFNVIPLLTGTLKCTLIAMLFSLPLSILGAVYVSQIAPHWLRQMVKPLIEILAGIPSVVLGFFALLTLATWFEWVFGLPGAAALMRALFGAGWSYTRLNALVAGVALGLAVIPIVFTISEDALRAVPKSYKEAAAALGASNYEITAKIIVPAALPGIFAACVLGFGRAVGETMIVWMASGMARIISVNPTDSTRTLTATIAAELAETVRGGAHYQMLFFLGTLLFLITFATNYFGGQVILRMKRKMSGGVK